MSPNFDDLLKEVSRITGVESRGSTMERSQGANPRHAEALRNAGDKLGVNPADIATIIGFETGGTYDPHKVGGENNRYRGLIQFGEDEQKKYYRPDQTFEDQVEDGVVRYFQDRFQQAGRSTRGATLEDLYTTVIAGNPNANRDAKDAFGTSARSGAAKMQNEHRHKALARFFNNQEPHTGDGDLLNEVKRIAEGKSVNQQDDNSLLAEVGKITGVTGNTPTTAAAPDIPTENAPVPPPNESKGLISNTDAAALERQIAASQASLQTATDPKTRRRIAAQISNLAASLRKARRTAVSSVSNPNTETAKALPQTEQGSSQIPTPTTPTALPASTPATIIPSPPSLPAGSASPEVAQQRTAPASGQTEPYPITAPMLPNSLTRQEIEAAPPTKQQANRGEYARRILDYSMKSGSTVVDKTSIAEKPLKDASGHLLLQASDQTGLKPNERRFLMPDGAERIFSVARGRDGTEIYSEKLAPKQPGAPKSAAQSSAPPQSIEAQIREVAAAKQIDDATVNEMIAGARRNPKLAADILATLRQPDFEADAGYENPSTEVAQNAPTAQAQPVGSTARGFGYDIDLSGKPAGMSSAEYVYREGIRQAAPLIGFDADDIEKEVAELRARGQFLKHSEENRNLTDEEIAERANANGGRFKLSISGKYIADAIAAKKNRIGKELILNKLRSGGGVSPEEQAELFKAGFTLDQISAILTGADGSQALATGTRARAAFSDALKQGYDPQTAQMFAQHAAGELSNDDLQAAIADYKEGQTAAREQLIKRYLQESKGGVFDQNASRTAAGNDAAYNEIRRQQAEDYASAELAEMRQRLPNTRNNDYFALKYENDASRAQASKAAAEELARRARVQQMGYGEYAGEIAKTPVKGLIGSIADTVKGVGNLTAGLEQIGVGDSHGYGLFVPGATAALDFFLGQAPDKLAASDTPYYKLGAMINSLGDALAVNPDVEKEFSAKIGTGAGSSLPFLFGGWVSKLPKTSAAILGALSSAGGMYDTAKQYGASETEAQRAALLAAGLLGTSEAVGIGGMLDRLNASPAGGAWRKLFQRLIVGTVKGALREAPEEGAQELYQAIGETTILRNTVDRNIQYNPGEILERGLVGAASGGLMGGAGHFIESLMHRAEVVGRAKEINRLRAAGKAEEAARLAVETEPLAARAATLSPPQTSQKASSKQPESSSSNNLSVSSSLENPNKENLGESLGERADQITPQPETSPVVTLPVHKEAADNQQVAPNEVAEKSPVAQENVPSSSGIVGFKTAKGSTYTVSGQSTQRTKSYHPEHGKADVGGKEASDVTYYAEDANALAELVGIEADKKRVFVTQTENGEIYAVPSYLNEQAGKFGVTEKNQANPIKLTTTPTVGAQPVELWKPTTEEGFEQYQAYRGLHVGNPITELFTSEKTENASSADLQSNEKPQANQQLSQNAQPQNGLQSNKDSQEEKPKREFSSTQVDLPDAESRRVLDFGKQLIDDADLTAEDGREDKPHVTVKFGLHTEDAAEVEKLLAGEAPFKVTLGKVSVFDTNPDFDVVKVDVESPELRRLNKKIADGTPTTDTHPEYKPHVTLAYVKKGTGAKYAGSTALEGTQISFDTLTFSGKDRTKTVLPLAGGETQIGSSAVNTESSTANAESSAGNAESSAGKEDNFPTKPDVPETDFGNKQSEPQKKRVRTTSAPLGKAFAARMGNLTASAGKVDAASNPAQDTQTESSEKDKQDAGQQPSAPERQQQQRQSNERPRSNRGAREQLRESREPKSAAIAGKTTKIRIPSSNRIYEAKFAVREIADVIPSHNPHTFEPNSDYYYVNDRHYDRQGQYQMQVINRSRSSGSEPFAPDILLNNSTTADTGAPVIDRDGNALGGNSRTMILHRVYAADAGGFGYKQQLIDDAAFYGLDAEAVSRMSAPVLVREISDDSIDAQAAITDLNASSTTALTTQERSVAEAGKMPASSVEFIARKMAATGSDATLNETLDKFGAEIVNKLIDDAVIQASERNVLLNDAGRAAPDAKTRISRMLLGRVFRDLDQMAAASPATLRNVERIAAPVLQVENSDWSISEPIENALDLVAEAKSRQVPIDDINKQAAFTNLLGEEFAQPDYSPLEVALAKILTGGVRQASEPFAKYASEFQNAESGGNMFGAMTAPEAQSEFFGATEQAALRSVADTGEAGDSLEVRIKSLVESDTKTSEANEKLVIREVTEAEKVEIKQKTGIELIGNLRHVIDKSGINHALKNHGAGKTEESRGQLPITKADFERIPEILSDYDEITTAGKSNKGLETIVYVKRFNGHVIVVEEFRRKRYELAFLSMRKYKKGSEFLLSQTETPTPEATLPYKEDDNTDGKALRQVADDRSDSGFFSQLERHLAAKMPRRASIEQVRNLIAPQSGVKPDEVEWSGINEFLTGKTSVAKQEVLDFLRAGGVRVEEIEKSADDSKFSGYVLPGGENYKELLIILPPPDGRRFSVAEGAGGNWKVVDAQNADAETSKYGARLYDSPEAAQQAAQKLADAGGYKSGHFDEKNVVAHLRTNERTDQDGSRVFFIEEIQSDWAQDKRKGKPVPEAPFIGKTDAWAGLAFKHALHLAVSEGFDKIAWTTGEQQAERYDLSKQIDRIESRRSNIGGDRYALKTFDKDGRKVQDEIVRETELEDYFGKDVARRIVEGGASATFDNPTVLSGANLSVGGAGMRGFYDRILPALVNKYVKKWNARTGESRISLETKEVRNGIIKYRYRGQTQTVHSIEITPAMRDSIRANGQPLFKIADKKSGADARRQRELKTADLSEIVPDVDSRVQSGDELRVSLEAGELFRTAFAEIENEDLNASSLIDGLFLDDAQIPKYVAQFDALAKSLEDAGRADLAEKIDDLTANLEQAANANGTAVVSLFDDAVPHERGHQTDYLAALPEAKNLTERIGDINKFLSRKTATGEPAVKTIYDKAYNQFFRRNGYQNKTRLDKAVIAQEISVYIHTGDYAKLGLSDTEAGAFIYHYLNAYLDRNGDAALANFEKYYEDFNLNRKNLETVKNARQERQQQRRSEQTNGGNDSQRVSADETKRNEPIGSDPSDDRSGAQESGTVRAAESTAEKPIGDSAGESNAERLADAVAEPAAIERERKQRRAAFSRILGQNVYYDSQSRTETIGKAQQLVADKGVDAAVRDALGSATPSATSMAVLYHEFERLNGLADHHREAGNAAEFAALTESIADLSSQIVARQVELGRAVEVSKMLAPMSPEVALIAAAKIKRNAALPKSSSADPSAATAAAIEAAKLSAAETEQVADVAKKLKTSNQKLQAVRAELAKSKRLIKRLSTETEAAPPRRSNGNRVLAQDRLLRQYQNKQSDILAKLKAEFPNSPLFNGETMALKSVGENAAANTSGGAGLRQVADLNLDSETQQALTDFAVLSVLQGQGYTDLIDTLADLTGLGKEQAAQFEQLQQIHSDAMAIVKPAARPLSDEARAKIQIRHEHYLHAGRFDGRAETAHAKFLADQERRLKEERRKQERALTEYNREMARAVREFEREQEAAQKKAARDEQNRIEAERRETESKIKELERDIDRVIRELQAERARAEKERQRQIGKEQAAQDKLVSDYEKSQAPAAEKPLALSGIAQDALADERFNKDWQTIFAIDRLTGEKYRSVNTVIKDLQAEFGLEIAPARALAHKANDAVIQIRANRRAALDEANNIAAEQRAALDAAQIEKTRAANDLNRMFNRLAAPPALVKRFNNDVRAKYVNNWATQAFNAIQAGTVSMPIEIGLDLIETGLRAAGVNIGAADKSEAVRPLDALLPYGYLLGNNRRLAESVTAEFPEQYFRVFNGLIGGDVSVGDAPLSDGKTGLSRIAHKWFDWQDKINDKLSTLSGAQLQELHFRSAIICGALDQTIRRKSGGAETLESVRTKGDFLQHITEADMTRAVDKALRATYASEITDPTGKLLKKGYDALDNILPIMMNPVTYARFTYTVAREMTVNPLIFGALDHPKFPLGLGGAGYTPRSIAKGILGWSGVAAAYALMSAFGGDDDDWETLYVFGKDNPPLNIKRWFPVSAYFYTAHLIRNFREDRPNPKLSEALEGYASLETSYFERGAGMQLATAAGNMINGDKNFADKTDDLGRATARQMGSYLGGYLSFVKPFKQLFAQIDREQAKVRDYGDTAADLFVKEIANTLPFADRAYNAPARRNPVTNEEIVQPFPLGRPFGINLVHPSFTSPKLSVATETAKQLFKQNFAGGEYTAEMRKAAFVRRELKEAVRRGEVKAADLSQKITDFIKDKTLSKESADRLRDDLKMSDLQIAIKRGFSAKDDADVKNLRLVWAKATDAEKDDLRKILRKKENLTKEVRSEFGLNQPQPQPSK